MLTAIFEKFKEKKANVVMALREAADAIYLTVSGQDVMRNTHAYAHAHTHTIHIIHTHIHTHTCLH